MRFMLNDDDFAVANETMSEKDRELRLQESWRRERIPTIPIRYQLV